MVILMFVFELEKNVGSGNDYYKNVGLTCREQPGCIMESK